MVWLGFVRKTEFFSGYSCSFWILGAKMVPREMRTRTTKIHPLFSLAEPSDTRKSSIFKIFLNILLQTCYNPNYTQQFTTYVHPVFYTLIDGIISLINLLTRKIFTNYIHNIARITSIVVNSQLSFVNCTN